MPKDEFDGAYDVDDDYEEEKAPFVGVKLTGHIHDFFSMLCFLIRNAAAGIALASFILFLVLNYVESSDSIKLQTKHLLNRTNPDCKEYLNNHSRLHDGNPYNDECEDNLLVRHIPSFEIIAAICCAMIVLFVLLSHIRMRFFTVRMREEKGHSMWWLRVFFRYEDNYMSDAVRIDSAPMLWIIAAFIFLPVAAVLPAMLGQHQFDQAAMMCILFFAYELCGAFVEYFNRKKIKFEVDVDPKNDDDSVEKGVANPKKSSEVDDEDDSENNDDEYPKKKKSQAKKGSEAIVTSHPVYNMKAAIFLILQLMALFCIIGFMCAWFHPATTLNHRYPKFINMAFALTLIVLLLQILMTTLRYFLTRTQQRYLTSKFWSRGCWECCHTIIIFAYPLIFFWVGFAEVVGKHYLGMQI